MFIKDILFFESLVNNSDGCVNGTWDRRCNRKCSQKCIGKVCAQKDGACSGK